MHRVRRALFLAPLFLALLVLVLYKGKKMAKNKTLKELRTGKDMTLDVLALKSGIDRSTLSRVERGLVQLKNKEKKLKLAEVLEVTEAVLDKALAAATATEAA